MARLKPASPRTAKQQGRGAVRRKERRLVMLRRLQFETLDFADDQEIGGMQITQWAPTKIRAPSNEPVALTM
jgi:hypothetical protein